MNKLYIHIFCYLLFSINSFGQNNIFNTRHLSVEDGLLGRRVNDIVQDNNGFIWIATNPVEGFGYNSHSNLVAKDSLTPTIPTLTTLVTLVAPQAFSAVIFTLYNPPVT